MGVKKLTLALLCFLATAFLYSESVAFQVIQHDKSSDEVRLSSLMIEESILDYFFNQGFIVTNSPAIAFNDSAKDSYYEKKAVAEAREGGIRYFILVTADFDVTDSARSEANVVDNIKFIKWELTDIRLDKKIAGGKVEPSGIKAKNMQTGVYKLSQKVASEIQTEIGRQL
ncbi:hypothetical protein [Treponema sp.]|uniref:hypothetical protein n=1 Tax=Treponema sp. TaxID=166 RepID=UPI0025EE2729|nr:hypothetical protein [Treponema sp.]MCR5217333.1 hypothetical protein [Treponema sp.]